MNILTKNIIVKSRGYVKTSRGNVFAPITKPYREDIQKIFYMINVQHADVWEVLPDKSQVKLTTSNFDKDNSKKEVEITFTAGTSECLHKEVIEKAAEKLMDNVKELIEKQDTKVTVDGIYKHT